MKLIIPRIRIMEIPPIVIKHLFVFQLKRYFPLPQFYFFSFPSPLWGGGQGEGYIKTNHKLQISNPKQYPMTTEDSTG
jgi:hypothetical protein